MIITLDTALLECRIDFTVLGCSWTAIGYCTMLNWSRLLSDGYFTPPVWVPTFIIMYFWQEGCVVLRRVENNPAVIPFLSKLTSCDRFTHLKVLKCHLRKTSWLSKSNLVKDSLVYLEIRGKYVWSFCQWTNCRPLTSNYEGRVYHTSPSRTGRPRWRVFSLAQQTNVSGLCIRDVHNVYESGRSACSHQSSSRRIPSRLSIIRLAICFSWAS